MKTTRKTLALFLVIVMLSAEAALAAEIQTEKTDVVLEQMESVIPTDDDSDGSEMNEEISDITPEESATNEEMTKKAEGNQPEETEVVQEETENAIHADDDLDAKIPEEEISDPVSEESEEMSSEEESDLDETDDQEETLKTNAIYQDQKPETIFQKTKESMLDHKNNSRNLDDSNFGRWQPEPKSLLQKEQAGGFSFFGSGDELSGLDILTGKASVNDSMQLGDFTSANEVDNELIENAKRAIENFKTQTGSYPDSLNDFSEYQGQWWSDIWIGGNTVNIADIQEKLTYTPKEEKTGKKSILCSGEFEHLSNPDATTVSKEYKEELRDANPTLCKTKEEMKNHESGCCYFSDTEVTSYTLSLKEQINKNIPLSGIKVGETESHDFEKLIADEGITAEVPEISKLVPADSLFLYFDSAEKYQEFSKALNNPLSELHKTLPIPTPEKMEQMIATRLGIPNAIEFLSFAEEFAFVGEDIRLFPSSDYAIIVKWKEENTAFIASLLQNGENVFGKAGEYFVFATHQKLFDDITGLATGESDRTPLSEEKDLYYSLGITEQKRDGFLFFSDAFIRKMVSPEYRISLRRQKTVVDAMNTLQYIVWAYKDLEGVFPKTWEEIEEKGYIDENSIYQQEDYIIGANGIVQHKTWGTPFAVTPVTRVPVNTVSEREKVWYEQDRDTYQSRYQQFFDPIGVSITVADKILFHTVILPLSESEEYETLEAIGGGKTKESFALLEDQNAILQGAMTFDFDNIVYSFYKPYKSSKMSGEDSIRQNDILVLKSAIEQLYDDNAEYPNDINEVVTSKYLQQIPKDPSGDEYGYEIFDDPKTGVKNQCYRLTARLSEQNTTRMADDGGVDPNLWEIGICQDSWNQFSLSELGPRTEENTINEEEEKQAAIKDFEEDFKEEVLYKSNISETDETEKDDIWEGRIFDFLGDEIGFGLGKNMVIDMQDISGIDGYLGILLTNKEKAEKLFNLVFEMLAKEMGGSGGFGIFQFQGALKNEYNGVKYYVVPTGFVNLYTIFLEDRVYFAVSQNTINNIIDGTNDADVSFSRLDAFLSGEKNVLLRADFSLVSEWIDGIPEKLQNDFVSEIMSRTEEKTFAAERMELENILGKEFMNTYFVHNSEIFGYSPLWKDGSFVWEKDGKQYSIDGIDTSEILENIKKLFQAYEKTGLSFAFTQHGAEIKVVFDNPEQEKIDERFISTKNDIDTKVAGSENNDGSGKPKTENPILEVPQQKEVSGIPRFVIHGSIGAGISAIFLVIYFLWRKRKNEEEEEEPEQKKRPPIDFNALEMDSDIPKHYAQFAKKHENTEPKPHLTQTEKPQPIYRSDPSSPPSPKSMIKEPESLPYDKHTKHLAIDDILQINKEEGQSKDGEKIETPTSDQTQDIAPEINEIQQQKQQASVQSQESEPKDEPPEKPAEEKKSDLPKTEAEEIPSAPSADESNRKESERILSPNPEESSDNENVHDGQTEEQKLSPSAMAQEKQQTANIPSSAEESIQKVLEDIPPINLVSFATPAPESPPEEKPLENGTEPQNPVAKKEGSIEPLQETPEKAGELENNDPLAITVEPVNISMQTPQPESEERPSQNDPEKEGQTTPISLSDNPENVQKQDPEIKKEEL